MASTPFITILGPTASGKTKVAVALAQAINGEIISADSRQVYKGMDIGTGKDLDEYTIEGQTIPHHLIDVRNAGEEYNVFAFQQDVDQALEGIEKRGNTPILCGGTGMYLSAVLGSYQHTKIPVNNALRDSLDTFSKEELLERFNATPQQGLSFDTSTKKRLIRAIEILDYLAQHPQDSKSENTPKSLIFGIDIPREVRRERITNRLHKRMEEGMIEEVQTLLSQGVSPDTLKRYGLEYKFITEHLEGVWSLEEMTKRLEVAIHQFAKRQMTYFRKMEKDGHDIMWINGMLSTPELVSLITEKIQSHST